MGKIPLIGQPWLEQGGFYVGPRLSNGEVLHVVIPGGVEYDIVARLDNAAERIAARGKINGFSDWLLGEQQDLMLAYINVPELFEREGIESMRVTATPYGRKAVWVVTFENGWVDIENGPYEYRVRPFRYARGVN